MLKDIQGVSFSRLGSDQLGCSSPFGALGWGWESVLLFFFKNHLQEHCGRKSLCSSCCMEAWVAFCVACSGFGEAGRENLGIWHHKMKILKSSALPYGGLHSSIEGKCITGVSGMPQQFQPRWPLPPLGEHIPWIQWDGFAGFNLQKWVYNCACFQTRSKLIGRIYPCNFMC